MLIRFSKMHGLGNDFVIIERLSQTVRLQSQHIQRIADRHLGIGCDQVILIEPPIYPDADFFYKNFNANGLEIGQCGNGARCAARFVYEQGLIPKTQLVADCISGRVHFNIEDEGQVTVNMGPARLRPSEIPFKAESQALRYELNVDGAKIEMAAVSMGNPHAVLQVADVHAAPVLELGAKISHHSRFPEQANVGFMEVKSREHIRLRVYERAAGETLACGTGACAAVVAGQLWGLLNHQVRVEFIHGSLLIEWKGGNSPIYMTGPSHLSFFGKIFLNF